MKEVSNQSFGLMVAYVLPGFLALWGMSCFSETVKSWLVVPAHVQPTVGGFLYLTLGSLYAGMTVSAIRWAVIDNLHHATGIPRPNWKFSSLQSALPAFSFLVENHYRYYQFYANCLVSMVFVGLTVVLTGGPWTGQPCLLGTGFVFIGVVFFAASRDTLRKYYERASQLLESCPRAEKGESHGERFPFHRGRGGTGEETPS